MAPSKKKSIEPVSRIADEDANIASDNNGMQTKDGADLLPAPFPIVGIGASAGGLAAFEAFFTGMPADKNPDMAFVLVQHLAPDHKSILTDIIKRYTRMQVFEVEDGMVVRPNCAYIIPPNRDMAFMSGALQLFEPIAPRGQHMPIDFFFRSLAHDQHERAICIILSGTGSDGTLGLRDIKGEGGMAIVQSLASAEYDGMPRSALATGLVDYELQPVEMAGIVISYVAHAFCKMQKIEPVQLTRMENALNKVFVLLRSKTGHDFSKYKPSTINRRIERRLAVQQIETMDEYVKFLQQTPLEVDALFHDLLIGVTNFFRDPAIFEKLEKDILPMILAEKPGGSSVRVWCAGCSTGEEAYSIAILMHEQLERVKKNCHIQLFATDIDNYAISTARTGIYPASIAVDISPERLSRFFSIEAGGHAYRINKNIRDMLIFSEQSIIKDPPFSQIDLISCRNLLIYMNNELQKTVVPLFHHSLNPGGILLLGSSETIGNFDALYTTLDRKDKIYQRKEDIHSTRLISLPEIIAPAREPDSRAGRSGLKSVPVPKQPLREIAEQTILKESPLVGALVAENGDILYLHGRTGMYLEPTPGETGTANIIKMAREGLQNDLSKVLHQATITKEIIRPQGISVKTNGHFTKVSITVRPVTSLAAANTKPMYMVILEKSNEMDLVRPAPEKPVCEPDTDINVHMEELRTELWIKDEYLQSANEELETSNEELKASNEEMQSVNEELQSTNEELETSKEELQSINEELSTVNAELQVRVHDLSQVNNDMNNLLAGTNIATIFLNYQMKIMRFTPSATKIINLITSDIGRPVSHIVSNLVGYDQLTVDLQAVLDTLVPKEVQVQTIEGKWYNMIIQPYRTVDNIIEGAVITFVDITEVKIARDALDISETRYRTLFETARVGIIILDADTGKIQNINPFLTELLELPEKQFIDKEFWNVRILKSIAADKDEFAALRETGSDSSEYTLTAAGGRQIIVEFISNVFVIDRHMYLQLNVRDISARNQAEML